MMLVQYLLFRSHTLPPDVYSLQTLITLIYPPYTANTLMKWKSDHIPSLFVKFN